MLGGRARLETIQLHPYGYLEYGGAVLGRCAQLREDSLSPGVGLEGTGGLGFPVLEKIKRCLTLSGRLWVEKSLTTPGPLARVSSG